MENIEIIATGSYLPKEIITNEKLNQKFKLEENWIEHRTGIKQRFISKEESIEELAKKSIEDLIQKNNFDIKKVEMIIVATTSTAKLMPGISFLMQKEFNIPKCICMDILVGCSGYINAIDIIRKYIAMGEIQYGLVIGVEKISEYLDNKDINTLAILGDGAGATLIGKSNVKKEYFSNIESLGQEGQILTCNNNENLYMDGKSVYKFGVTKTVENIENLLEKTNTKIDEIKYIIPHQSNIKILNSILKRLNIEKEKAYINIEEIGNTFNASIPICLDEMYNKKLLKNGDKVILIGYGGGLNIGSILIEI